MSFQSYGAVKAAPVPRFSPMQPSAETLPNSPAVGYPAASYYAYRGDNVHRPLPQQRPTAKTFPSSPKMDRFNPQHSLSKQPSDVQTLSATSNRTDYQAYHGGDFHETSPCVTVSECFTEEPRAPIEVQPCVVANSTHNQDVDRYKSHSEQQRPAPDSEWIDLPSLFEYFFSGEAPSG